ncbi:hypothetical protein EVAR_65908_1 [Eumeta japonica]|uniref:Uncharacterized protein n=1 Tax=Eumeta variegata TaxID=151549 RepID=A0A4C1ZV40_EUMVA|nr:hypothetical protein EVAR_65908_1 [Eumeta japonica]
MLGQTANADVVAIISFQCQFATYRDYENWITGRPRGTYVVGYLAPSSLCCAVPLSTNEESDFHAQTCLSKRICPYFIPYPPRTSHPVRRHLWDCFRSEVLKQRSKSEQRRRRVMKCLRGHPSLLSRPDVFITNNRAAISRPISLS